MELKITMVIDAQTWDDVVKSSPQGTLFHTWKWLKIMEKHNFIKLFFGTYHGQLHPLAVMMGNEIIGLIPVFIYNTPFMKMAYSPPFGAETPYLGPILNKALNPKRRQVIFYEFNKVVDNYLKNEMKINYISIHSSPGLSDPRPFFWNGYNVLPYFTNIINLREGEKMIWGGFNTDVRKKINKLNKFGITGEIGTKSDLMEMYDLLKGLNRIHASKKFIEDIFDNFSPEFVNLVIAKKDGTLLTGELIINFNNKASIWVGNPKSDYNGFSPNYSVIWYGIQWACKNKFDCFEIIGASDLSLFPFKRQFNGEIEPYYIMKWYSPFWNFGKKIQSLLK
jgi:hypothetical protein